MFVTFFNSHAIKNQILIIMLEGTLRHKHTQKRLIFGFLKTFFWIFSNFQIFLSKHIKTLQNTIKTLKNSEKQL